MPAPIPLPPEGKLEPGWLEWGRTLNALAKIHYFCKIYKNMWGCKYISRNSPVAFESDLCEGGAWNLMVINSTINLLLVNIYIQGTHTHTHTHTHGDRMLVQRCLMAVFCQSYCVLPWWKWYLTWRWYEKATPETLCAIESWIKWLPQHTPPCNNSVRNYCPILHMQELRLREEQNEEPALIVIFTHKN